MAERDVAQNLERSSDEHVFDAAQVFEKIRPSVAKVESMDYVLWFIPVWGIDGTGFVVGNNQNEHTCEIATDNHLIKYGSPTVQLGDTTYDATIEKVDLENDLAVLQISDIKDPQNTCPILPLADSLKPDEQLISVGASSGVPQYSSASFLDYFQRSEASELPPRTGEDLSRIMIGATIDNEDPKGYSGGPLVNSFGQVVGINAIGGENILGAELARYLSDDLEELHHKHK